MTPQKFSGSGGRSGLWNDEADMQRAFTRFDAERGGSEVCAWELKFTKGRRMGMNEGDIKLHQRDSLLRFGWGKTVDMCEKCGEPCGAWSSRRGRLAFKISDASPETKPFDGFSGGGGGGSAYVIVGFNAGERVVRMDIWAYERMRCRLKVSGWQSCTAEDMLDSGGEVI